jgi:radical SAM superfamily enzyme YgiQ (UPF0313 family)
MNILLINPPIYDFAAYDLWLKPLGLLYIASILKQSGANITLIDCMDRNHPALPVTKSNEWGCGKYIAKEVLKPEALKNVPRKYKRYGMPEDIFKKTLESQPKPDAILVTSGMTYWYPGVIEAINTMKGVFPGVPVILGGVYATICYSHAQKNSGADHIIKGNNLPELLDILKPLGLKLEIKDLAFENYPSPMYELYSRLDYAVLRTSIGCPYRCSYCAISIMENNIWQRKAPERVVDEIKELYQKGIKNFAFYDDALLYKPKEHIEKILAGIIKTGIKASFHSPNGLHAKYITKELAVLFKESGIIMPRISLETTNKQRQTSTGGKVSNLEFEAACHNLFEAGYKKGEIGSYILMGMQGQSFEEVTESMNFANNNGALALLAEYSPIPGTKDWEEVKELLPFNDPLWHNNSLYPLYKLSDWKTFQNLKDLAHKLNKQLIGH